MSLNPSEPSSSLESLLQLRYEEIKEMSDHELIETAKDDTKHSLWTIKEDDPTLLRLYIEADVNV